MKTLDEVIKNFEICRKARGNIRGCDGCTYADDADVACIMHNESDVLYYLNEYRDSKEIIADAMEMHTQAVLRHMDETDKLAVQRFVMEYDNPPLTWDELREMDGKPVWVEMDKPDVIKAWFLICQIDDIFLWVVDSKGESHNFPRVCLDTGLWQAYRKEQHETGD